MDNTLLHIALPETSKSEYSNNDLIQFGLDFENRAIILNSIRLEGTIQVNSTGSTPVTYVQDIKMDPKIGCHALLQSVNTSFQNQGLIENVIEYPRKVKMRADAEKSANDMLQSNYVCELRAPSHDLQALLLKPKVPKAYNGAALAPGVGDIANIDPLAQFNPDFSIIPQICINQATQGSRMSFRTSGTIRLSFILERYLSTFYGRDVDGNTNYKLSNLRVVFQSVPDVGKPMPIQMRTSLCIKTSMTSANANLSSKVPAVCDSVALSYLPHARENNASYSNQELSKPPGITRLTYLFNDAFNKFVTFQITDTEEMLKRGLDGLMSGKSNDINWNAISANDGLVHGLNWNQFVDLSQQKFNVNIESLVSNVTPYHVFLYFNSLTTV